MKLAHWILDDDGEPVETDLLTWAAWLETSWPTRRVLYDQIGRVDVSTVFLGLDHNFFDDGPPVLWETMIFGGPFDSFQRRYTSRLDALRGHAAAVDLVERYRVTPRRTKKALRNWGAHSWRLRPGDRRRVRRVIGDLAA